MNGIQLSSKEIETLQSSYERQIRLAALQAETQARGMAHRPLALAGIPDFPPDPDFLRWAQIALRYADEGIRHLPDSQGLMPGILWFATSPDAASLRKRLDDALAHHKDDPTLFRDVLQAILSHGGVITGTSYGSFMIGLETGGHAIGGAALTTGVAIPLKGEGPVKWFSGATRSSGPIVEAGVSLLFGLRTKTPEKLTGQFYGGHASIEVEIALGSNLYFDTSKELAYEGFATSIGVGIGGGFAVTWGWELVAPG